MRTIIIVVAALVYCNNTTAQVSRDELTRIQIDKSKTGNFKDAFSNLFQFALKNISNEENALELNSTLYALAKEHRPTALKEIRNRTKISFLRNFQINAKLNLTEDYKFNGFAGGITYGIINKRDKGFINLIGTDIAMGRSTFDNLLAETTVDIRYQYGARFADDQSDEISQMILAQEVMPNDEITDAFVARLNELVAANAYFQSLQESTGISLTTGQEVAAYLSDKTVKFVSDLETKPLWTIAVSGGTHKTGGLNRGLAETVFLVGKKGWEVDARAKFAYDDTLAVSMPRSFFNSKLGINFVVDEDEQYTSTIEFKAYAEFNKVLKNRLPDEEEETFLANADLRFRLTDDLWVPLTIKYDIENENFLGFLNVTYNFGD